MYEIICGIFALTAVVEKKEKIPVSRPTIIFRPLIQQLENLLAICELLDKASQPYTLTYTLVCETRMFSNRLFFVYKNI